MAEHPGATTNPIVHQQRSSYSGPNSYPSPSLQNSYAFPPQSQQPGQPGDYRTPSTSGMSQPQHPVNLPPIRSFDGQSQPTAQQSSSGYPTPSTLPQPGPPMNSYYHHPYLPPPPGPQPSSLAAQAAQMGMRYPMPPHIDQRPMSGGRHKKEIKRRTKTGCLTCRKRRIKVSEVISIFGGLVILEMRFEFGQDRAAWPLASELATSASENRSTSTTDAPSSLLHHHADCDSVTKRIPPAAIAKNLNVTAWATIPFLNSSPVLPHFSQHPALHRQQHQRRALPARHRLHTRACPKATRPQQPLATRPASPQPAPQIRLPTRHTSTALLLTLRLQPGKAVLQWQGIISIKIIPIPTDRRPRCRIRVKVRMTLLTQRATCCQPRWILTPSIADHLKIDDLFALHNITPSQPPPRTEPLPSDLLDEVKNIYEREYAPGLDRLLETTWYTTTGLTRLPHYTHLCEEVDYVLSEMRRVQSEDREGQRRLESAETKLIWDLACMCRMAAPAGFSPTSRDPEDQAKLAEVQLRLGIVEGLLCSTNPTGRATNGAVDFRQPTAYPEPKTNQIVYFSREFWRCLGLYVSLPADDSSPATLRSAEQALSTLRGILQMLENRDVLYSIAVARHFGSRLPEFPDQGPQAWNNDDSDVKTKVAIAKRFCEDESGGKGTTQVVQRMCGMAVRSWSLWRKDMHQSS